MAVRAPLVFLLVVISGQAAAASQGPRARSADTLKPAALTPPSKSAPAPKPPPATVATPVPPQPLEAAAPAPVPSARRVLFIGAGAGVRAPFAFLRPGWDAGVEMFLPLELLDGRLALRARAGAFQMAGVGPRIIPGRGYDPAFIQNRLGGQLEVGVELTLWDAGPHLLAIGAGASGQLVHDTFLTLNTTATEVGPGAAMVGVITYRLALGPGALGASLRLSAGAAALGSLAQIGSSSLSGATALLSYSYAFPLQENRR